MTIRVRGKSTVRNAIRRVIRLLVAAVQRLAAPEFDSFDIGDRMTMGRETYARPLVRWYEGDNGHVRIGSFCSIADDVVITIGGNHSLDWPSTFPFRARRQLGGAFADGHPVAEADVVIGSDVWVGRGARILAGVRIGHGAVVGAYTVVAKDVRPYAIVVGNPAREVRRRFSDEQIEALLKIAWWEWPDDRIDRMMSHLNQPDVDGFIRRCGLGGSDQDATSAPPDLSA
jgi:acetyltransferase-like isoleucine patch superfamily enzyme